MNFSGSATAGFRAPNLWAVATPAVIGNAGEETPKGNPVEQRTVQFYTQGAHLKSDLLLLPISSATASPGFASDDSAPGKVGDRF
jgi:hypothetical protein